jgi:hypothetical protein
MANNDDSDIEDTIDKLSEMVKTGASWWESNKHYFTDETGGGESINMSGPDPLREAHIDQDTVRVVSEVKSGSVSSMGVNYTDEGVEFVLGDERFVADVPDDIIEGSIDATMKNGVLRVMFDRDNADENEDDDIALDINDNDDSEDNELDPLDEIMPDEDSEGDNEDEDNDKEDDNNGDV